MAVIRVKCVDLLDVYKRQVLLALLAVCFFNGFLIGARRNAKNTVRIVHSFGFPFRGVRAVSYTHLDVYKRQADEHHGRAV